MKIKETLTNDDYLNILMGESIGVFKEMFSYEDTFYHLIPDMSISYYMQHSGEKTAGKIFENMRSVVETLIANEFPDESIPDEDEYELTVKEFTNYVIGFNILRPKFIEKWNKIYNALVSEYNPLTQTEISDRKTGSNSDNTTYNITLGKTGNNSDSIAYDTVVEDNGSTGTNETTTTSRENSEDVFGFNSTSPVGDNIESESTTETVVGLPTDNTSHNEQTKTGTENKTISISETENKTGTDNKSFTINETYSKSGRTDSGSTLLQQEISFRDKQNFFDIVFKDIDNTITLQIYN